MKKYEGHTPGPWRYNNPRSNQRIVEGGKNYSEVVAEAYAKTVEVQKANALLIADAPMLAEQNAKMLTEISQVRVRLFDPAPMDLDEQKDLAYKLHKLIAEIEAES